MRSSFPCAAAICIPFTGLLAQIPAGHAVIATELNAAGGGAAATQVLDVDPVSGAFRTISRFASDRLAPLVVTTDPVNDDLIVVLDGIGSSRFVRLTLRGLTVVGERTLATVSGTATDAVFAGDGDLYATFGGPNGALVRIPRSGGPSRVVTALPRATAISGFRFFQNRVVVAQSGEAGPPAIDPQLTAVTLEPFATETTTWPGYRPFGVTGIVDVAAALVRQLITHDDGTVAESLFFGSPRSLSLTPQLPPGSTVAVVGNGFNPSGTLFLGGSAHPFLKTFDLFQGQPLVWRNLAGPLPGNPVDLDLSFRATGNTPFGRACGAPREMRISPRGIPFLGNAQFGIDLSAGSPNSAALFVLGFDDQSWQGARLPLGLPNGCELFVAADFTAALSTNGEGSATQRLPVPNSPALQGLVAFAQWLQAPGGSLFATSAGVAVRIGI